MNRKPALAQLIDQYPGVKLFLATLFGVYRKFKRIGFDSLLGLKPPGPESL